MKWIFVVLSILSLIALIVFTMLYFYGKIDLAAIKTWMLVATIVWFVTAPFWIKPESA